MLPILLAQHWYDQGNWPLVGTIAALLASQVFTYWQMLRESRANLVVQLTLKRIELLSEQLAEFYNPLYALLAANGHVNKHFGPDSFPNDEIKQASAIKNWQAMKERVILPNNKRLVEILRSQTHLMSASDHISHYLDLNNHLVFYEVFNERPSEAYEHFRFPVKVFDHVQKVRSDLIAELNALKAMKKR